MKSNRFDIGIAPLEMNHFCERKYFNKYIEYTTYGICGVYSNCAPYTLVVKNEINGFLCDNSEEGWINGLSKAIENNSVRNQCIMNAQNHIISDFVPDKIYDDMRKDIPELVEYMAPKSKKYNFLWLAKYEYMIFKFLCAVHLTFKSLKEDGIQKTIVKIKNKFIKS